MTTPFTFPGPDTVSRIELENGMILLVRPNPTAPVAILEGYLPCGAIHEPAAKAGLASFTAALTTRGSQHYDFDAFNDAVESVGASIVVSGGDHVTNVSTESLTEDFPKILEILADVLRRPTFPEEHIERLRGQWLVRLQEREQDTRSVAYRRFHELLYGDHPYGRPASGYPETIRAITRNDIEAFHSQFYSPRGAILVISGDVTTETALALVETYFGDWNGPAIDQSLPPLPEQTDIRREHVPMPGKVQADLVVGCLALSRKDPDYYAVQVANNILGQFGLMGRLGEVVREQQGLAYYSYSVVDADLDRGPWLAVAGVNPANVNRAAESILAEFKRLATEPVPEEELADSKANMTGRLPLALETNDGVALNLLNMEWFDLGLDYLLTYASHIEAVTAEDVAHVASKYLRTDAYTLVVAGPEIK